MDVLLFDVLIHEIPINTPCLWLTDELSRDERKGSVDGPIVSFPQQKSRPGFLKMLFPLGTNNVPKQCAKVTFSWKQGHCRLHSLKRGCLGGQEGDSMVERPESRNFSEKAYKQEQQYWVALSLIARPCLSE